MTKQNDKNQGEKQLDLFKYVVQLWNDRRIVIWTMAACVVIGLLSYIMRPTKYSTRATLLPSYASSESSLGNLGALASLAGVNVGGGTGGISPDLYPTVSQSVPYLLELINVPLDSEDSDRAMTLLDIAKADTSWHLADYTIGLPRLIFHKLFPPKPLDLSGVEQHLGQEPGDRKFRVLTEYETKAMTRLSNDMLSVDIDPNTDLIVVNVTTEDRLMCAQLAQAAVNLLQEYIIKYKIAQSMENVEFIENSYNDAKVEYERAREALYNYTDRHRDVVIDRTELEYHRLSDTFDIAASVFKTLAEQLSQARIAVKAETPVFSILEPVVLPKEKSSPKFMLTMIVSLFLGGVIGVAIVMCRIAWQQITIEFKSYKKEGNEEPV